MGPLDLQDVRRAAPAAVLQALGAAAEPDRHGARARRRLGLVPRRASKRAGSFLAQALAYRLGANFSAPLQVKRWEDRPEEERLLRCWGRRDAAGPRSLWHAQNTTVSCIDDLAFVPRTRLLDPAGGRMRVAMFGGADAFPDYDRLLAQVRAWLAGTAPSL